MAATEKQRRKVRQFIAEQEKITIPARLAAKRVTSRIVNGLIRSNGENVADILERAWASFEAVLADVMLLGHLQGHQRVNKEVPKSKKKQLALASSLFQSSVRTAKRLALMSGSELGELTDKYRLEAADLTAKLARTSTEQVLREMAAVQELGLHSGSAKKRVAEALQRAGFRTDNPSVVETITRTQTQVAYNAGRWHANQDPAIQEILWGYIYINPDDERSRPTHAALDGTTLPKDHPRWQVIWPPNGYNCRCSVIELFEPEEIVNPTGTVQDGNKQAIIQADEGWRTNLGREFLPARPVLLQG